MKIVVILIAIAFFIFAQAWGFFHTPADATMGNVQKLMYVHVPAAWNSFIAFFVVFISSLFFLVRKKRAWDHLAASAAEVGCVLTALTLALGSIWGRPTWGVWWTWDARLTTTAILLLLYLGYLSLRRFIEDPDKRARVSAPLGVIIFLNVPLVYYSVVWWRTLHQAQSTPSTVDPAMATALRLNALAFLGVLSLFIWARYQIMKKNTESEEAESLPPELKGKPGVFE